MTAEPAAPLDVAELSAAERGSLDPEWQRAFGWIEKHVGGRVVRARRQERWRPAWFLDVERDGENLPLYFRGDRGVASNSAGAIEYEAQVLEILESEGLPVPHVYGVCPDPLGVLLQRCAGRENLGTCEDPAEREAVLDHYIDLLAQMHSIDTAKFEAIGCKLPMTAEEVGLGDFDGWERSYRAAKARPEPMIEFGIQWLRRNIPPGRTKAVFLQGDAGQFIYDQGRVTALLDFEIAFVGDPAHDLGGLRTRDISEPLGDIQRAYARYERITGEPIDMRAIHYHTTRFALVTPMAVAHLVGQAIPGLNYAQYLGWYYVYNRMPMEIIAGLGGFPLEAPQLPGPRPTRASLAHDVVVAELGGDKGKTYELDGTLRTAQYLREVDRLGPELEAHDLDEAAALLGHRPASWDAMDADLERFVLDAGPEHDAALVHFFHRHCLRQEALLAPAARELKGVRFQSVE